MWAPLWPGAEPARVPVTSITNGVHLMTWLSADMAKLFDRYLDSHWRERHDEPAIWERVLAIPDEELWKIRDALRRYLVTFVRERVRDRWITEKVSAARVVAGGTLLSPDVLTIGFARRFATYKRAELIFRDPESAGAHPQLGEAAGADHLRRQGASRRRWRQARAAERLSPRHRSDVRRPHRLRRRLRPARRASPRPGLRRVAEQPAQAARGQRHQRHEGVDERRRQPQHRRRLVGRGLHRRQRLPDRSGRRAHAIPRRWTRPTPKRSIACSRTRSCRPTTSATSAACRGAGWAW